jgi:hypothetical protein
MIKKLTTHQIIDETVEYYKNNPRAIQDDFCEYLTDDGKMCAVGRCLTNKSVKIAQKKFMGKDFMSLDLNIIKFKSKYQGHSVDFWYHLQFLHDAKKNWDGNKLSEVGERQVKVLKEKFVNI